MHTDKEKEKNSGKKDYEEIVYFNEMIKMEDLAEDIWIKRETFLANDIKVDQFPGFDSMHEEKAIYRKKKFVDELELRISRRISSSENIEMKKVADGLKGNVSKLLKLPTNLRTNTDKINHSLAIIEAITKALNGDC